MKLLSALIALCALTVVVVLGVSAFGGSGTAGVRDGIPKAADFLAFYTGGVILASGHGDRLYDRHMYRRIQDRIADSDVKYHAVYPPPLYQAMTLVRPLGYERAAQLFLVGQALLVLLAAWLLVLAVPELGAWSRPAIGLVEFSPFAVMNVMTGQGAGLWLTLLASGILLLRRGRPVLAGMVLGVLCAKPSIALAVAAFITLSGQWRALLGFAAGGATVLAASLVAHGPEPWIAWAEWMRSPAAGTFWPMPERQMTWRTLFGWPLRATQLGTWATPAAAALGALAAIPLVKRAWRLDPADPRWPLRAGLLLSLLILCLPHMIEYDAGTHALLGLGIAAALRPALGQGAWALVALWLAPVLFPLSAVTHVALGPLAVTAALFAGARHARDVRN